MAFTVTARNSTNNNTTATATFTSGSFTPSANSLLVTGMAAEADRSGGSLGSVGALSGGSLTHTERYAHDADTSAVYSGGFAGSYAHNQALWTAPVGGSPASMTVTVDPSSSSANQWGGFTIIDITGHDTGTPILQTVDNQSANNLGGVNVGGTLTFGTLTVGSLVVVHVAASDDNGAGMSAPTIGGQAMTEHYDQATGFCQAGMWSRTITGAESNSVVTWSSFGTALFAWTIIGIEVAAAAASGVTGTSASTLANVTSAASGTSSPPAITGTSTSTLDDVTSSASGTSAGPGTITGTSAVTLADVTSTASGTYTTTVPAAPTGLLASPGDTQVTLAWTAPSNGGAAITGYKYRVDGGSPVSTGSTATTVIVTGLTNGVEYDFEVLATNSVGDGAWSSLVSATPAATTTLYPATVDLSGRKAYDQNGDVFLLKNFAAWGMSQRLTDAQITTQVEAIAAAGFNSVNFAIGGGYRYDSSWDTPGRYKNAAGEDFWTGTPWQSDLGDAWGTIDWIVAECDRVGICASMSMMGAFGSTGAKTDWASATNTDMYNVGVAVATRYDGYDNLIWHLDWDDTDTVGGTTGQRAEAFMEGVNDTEGATRRPLRWIEVGNGSTTDEQGWLQSTEWNSPVDCIYDYQDDSVVRMEGVWADNTVLTGDCEPPYVGAPHYGGSEEQQLRERCYAVFLEGGTVANYGHEDFWPFDANGLYTAGVNWFDVLDEQTTADQTSAFTIIDEFVAVSSWAPSAFVTTGEGTGDTKAAAGNSTTAAVAYFPTSRTIAVNTSLISGASTVRLRWFDPSAGTFTLIAAEEATQTGRSVTHPGTNTQGDADWVLVVDTVEASTFTGTSAVTLADVTSAASGTVTAPVFTGTSAVTLDDVTSAASGTSTPPTFTGTAAATLDAVTSTASGTVTAPVFTGTSASTLDDVTSAATGTHTPPVFTGTSASTLDDVTSTAAGTHSPPGNNTGTASSTLADVTSTASGTVAAPVFTGSSSSTLDDVTSSASGTSTAPGSNTGSASSTLDDVTSAASGTVTAPVFTGSSSSTLADVTSVASGTVTAPGTVTGSSSSTLDDITSSAAGTFTPPPITGSASSTLAAVTSTATGTYTPPPITGTSSSTLADVTSTAAGTHSPPGSNTGSSTSTLDDVTSTATGAYTPPPIAGTSTSTLAAVTSTATGTVAAPTFTGTSAVTLEDVTSTATGAPGPPIPVGIVTLSLAAPTVTLAVEAETGDTVTLVVLSDTP